VSKRTGGLKKNVGAGPGAGAVPLGGMTPQKHALPYISYHSEFGRYRRSTPRIVFLGCCLSRLLKVVDDDVVFTSS